MPYKIKSEKERRMDIDRIMSKQIDPNDFTPMNIHELRNYCYYGFSSDKHRPKYWKVLLGYFSKNKFNTSNYYREKRRAYSEYIKGIEEYEEEYKSIFNVIRDDLSRTVILPASEGSGKKCSFLDGSSVNNQMNNRMVLERILKCFVVHNKSVGYIQGMHMLLIHIYYVMIHSEDTEDVRYSEEDSFFCFVSFISELFEQIISNVEQGGESMQVILNKIYNIIETIDPELYKTCREKKIFESGLCIKWIMFAFSSEFKVENVIWLWDRLLSDKKRFEMIFYCAASVFVIMKNVICTEEVESCFEVLQSPSLVDVETIFNTADAMRLKVSKLPPLEKTSKPVEVEEVDGVSSSVGSKTSVGGMTSSEGGKTAMGETTSSSVGGTTSSSAGGTTTSSMGETSSVGDTTEENISEQTLTEENASEHNVTDQNTTEQIITEQNLSEQNLSEKNSPIQTSPEANSTEHPATEHPATEHPATEHPATEQIPTEHLKNKSPVDDAISVEKEDAHL